MMHKTLNADEWLTATQSAVLHTNSLWKRIGTLLWKKKFDFPVVYYDGLISRRQDDIKDRNPWGIKIGNFILHLYEPPKLTFSDAEKYAAKQAFAGRKPEVLTYKALTAVKNNLKKVNWLLERLGGDPLQKDWYRSATIGKNTPNYACAQLMDVAKKNDELYGAAMNDRYLFRIGLRLNGQN